MSKRGRSSTLGSSYMEVFQSSPRAQELLAPEFASLPKQLVVFKRHSAGFKSWTSGTQRKAKMLWHEQQKAKSPSLGTAATECSSTSSKSLATNAPGHFSTSSRNTPFGRSSVSNFRGKPTRPLSAPANRPSAKISGRHNIPSHRRRFVRPSTARPDHSTRQSSQLSQRGTDSSPRSRIVVGPSRETLRINLPSGALHRKAQIVQASPTGYLTRPSSAYSPPSRPGTARESVSNLNQAKRPTSRARPATARVRSSSLMKHKLKHTRDSRRPQSARQPSSRLRGSIKSALTATRRPSQQQEKSSSFDLTQSGIDKELLHEVRSREIKNSEAPQELSILEHDLELRPLNPRMPSGSHNAMYFFLCGYQERLRGNLTGAVMSFTRAISLDSKDYRSYVNRAFALVRLGRRSDALRDLKVAAILKPDEPENLYNLGLGYQRSDMHKLAVGEFTKCLEKISLHLCPPWTEKRRLDAVTYLTLRQAVYKSRSMSLRQERKYHRAALDMIKSGGAQQLSLKNGLTGSYQRALRRGAAAYFDCGELYGHKISGGSETDGNASDITSLDRDNHEEEEESMLDRDADSPLSEKSGIIDDNKDKQHETIWHRLAEETRLLPSKEHSPDDINTLAGVAHQVSILSSLPMKHLRRICSHMGVIELEKDEVVFYQGSVPHCLYLILHGEVSVHLHENFGHADNVEKERHEREERKHLELEEAKNAKRLKAAGLVLNAEEDESPRNDACDGTETDVSDESLELMPVSWEAKKFLKLTDPDGAMTPERREMLLDAAAIPTSKKGLGRFLVSLHAGSSFGEQALAVEEEKNLDKRRNATCVAQGDGAILLTVSKEDFDRVVRKQLLQEVKEVETFLRSVSLFSMVTSAECMKNLATYASIRKYDVDDVIIAEGTVQEEGIFLVRNGKCEIVSGLPLHDHKTDVETELQGLVHEAAKAKDPSQKKYYETMIQKLTTELEILVGGSTGGVSRRFTVKHNPEESYDYRRMAAFATELEQSARRKCWNSNDKGKVLDLQTRNLKNLTTMKAKQLSEKTSDMIEEIKSGAASARLDKMRSMEAQDEHKRYKEIEHMQLSHEGKYFVRQKPSHPNGMPIRLAELVPRDTFGFESVFSITKQNKVHNTLTGRTMHVRNRVSLVAKTKVEILFIAKKDFFNYTTFKTRQIMRKKLMNPKLDHLGVYSRIFRDPSAAIQREQIWSAYKKRVTETFDARHAKMALHV